MLKTHRWRAFVALCTGVGITSVAGASGPDVVVASLYNLTHWGASGGIEAYSVGTISCNLGDQNLTWHNFDSLRPVIAQNMYRIKDGRMEQLGQSWLKWGFLALNQDFCGACNDPGTGSLLGVNCSDPYSASLNGSQSGLGPKSVVNPYTGSFPASHSTPGSGTIAGRLQVKTVDVAPGSNPGAVYFVEGQYIHPEDAQFDNALNNASHRRIWIESDLDITFTNPAGGESSDDVTRPAILAWPEFVPGVAVVPVDIPGEGRLYLGWKPTNLGGGQWNYEFAVFNLNSDRAVGGFSVTVPLNATVSNQGFHDVPWHSGEVYSNTDWTPKLDPGSVAWTTAEYGANPNANAIRFGTMYNFRFDANVDPSQLGDVRLDLFKPGTPSFVTVSPPDPGANDECAEAFVISNGSFSFETSTATTDGPDEPGACNLGGYTHVENDIWFMYTATCSGDVTVSLCGSSFDTKLAIYNGVCPSAPGEVLICNDDFCGAQSEVTFEVSEGRNYLIRIGGRNGATGSGTLTVDCAGGSGSNGANNCADAAPVSDGTHAFSTSGATTDGPSESLCSNAGDNHVRSDIWYLYTAPCNGTTTVGLCGSNYDTKLAAYAGSTCPTASGSAIACNDDSCSLQSQITFDTTAGQEYLIRVGGYNGATGSGTMTITCNGSGGLCPNDDVGSAIVLGGLPFNHTGDTTACNNDYDEVCNFTGSTAADAIYAYTPASNEIIDVSLCSSGYDTKVYIYESGITPGAPYACNDDGCPGGAPDLYRSLLDDVVLTAGTTYYIVVDGYGAEEGVYFIDITREVAGPPNDDCADATPLVVGAQAFTNEGATTDGPTDAGCPANPEADVWYSYAAPCDGTMSVDTCGTGFDTAIAVYAACPAGPGEVLACNDDACGSASSVTVAITAGTTYHVRVGGAGGATGVGTLNLAVTFPDIAADIDHDGDVDLGDLSVLLANFGVLSGATFEDGDIDGDGDVDLADLGVALATFGNSCL